MELKLTSYQAKLLAVAMNQKAIATREEQEALTLIFKSNGLDVPQGEIKFENETLIYGPTPAEEEKDNKKLVLSEPTNT